MTDAQLRSERAAAELKMETAPDALTIRLLRYRIDEIDRELLARREETAVVRQTLSRRVFRGRRGGGR